MVVRKRRKKNKVRGNRTHGAGGTKNRRGSGFRGGVGKAGSHKHKFSKYYIDFGVKRTFKAKPKKPALNLNEISDRLDEWLATGKAVKENGMVVIDAKALGFGKILGRGKVAEKILVKNALVSGPAAEKIIAAGGSVGETEETLEEEEEEGEEEEAQK